MFRHLDAVALTYAFSDYDVDEGVEGRVAMVHQGGVAYEVEFIEPSGETEAVVTLVIDSMRPAKPDRVVGG